MSQNIFSKPNVDIHEYHMHKYIYDLKLNNLNIPRPISYDPNTKIFQMEKINGMNLADYYGEQPSDIDSDIFDKIREIISTLYDEGILYPDITGYNFIMDDSDHSKIWIIDFEHSDFYDPNTYSDDDQFIQGE
jgi:tRNA A-37 threonylcarbamoyl transferase component Bud32